MFFGRFFGHLLVRFGPFDTITSQNEGKTHRRSFEKVFGSPNPKTAAFKVADNCKDRKMLSSGDSYYR